MFTSRFFTIFTLSVIKLLILTNYCACINSESTNTSSVVGNFSPAVATWYDSPTGPGSGGACGFANDVGNAPYDGMTAAGNQNLFKSGNGCGVCYQVKCTENINSLCSGNPITLTITNECPGACNNEAFHFDLSGKAFGALAKPGQAVAFRKLGRIDVQYQRVQCNYKDTGLTFKIDEGSNPNFLAFAIENVNGDGDIGSVELLSSNSKSWLAMQHAWGATWKIGLPGGISGPYSVRLTTLEFKKSVVASNVIPANWAPRQYYRSNVNVPAA